MAVRRPRSAFACRIDACLKHNPAHKPVADGLMSEDCHLVGGTAPDRASPARGGSADREIPAASQRSSSRCSDSTSTSSGNWEDDDDRASLVRLCLQRASADPTTTVLIGDTPADVKGARVNGVRVIAIASGSSNESDLRSAGAEVVLPDLTDTERVVRLFGRLLA